MMVCKLIFFLLILEFLTVNCSSRSSAINMRLNDGKGSRLIMLEKIDALTYKTKQQILKSCYTGKYPKEVKKLRKLEKNI